MVCTHLRKLYQLCHDEGLRLGGADLIHIVCEQCGVQEICPANLINFDEPDEQESELSEKENSASS